MLCTTNYENMNSKGSSDKILSRIGGNIGIAIDLYQVFELKCSKANTFVAQMIKINPNQNHTSWFFCFFLLPRPLLCLLAIFIFSEVFCRPRLSWITWCYHMSSTHHATPVKEEGTRAGFLGTEAKFLGTWTKVLGTTVDVWAPKLNFRKLDLLAAGRAKPTKSDLSPPDRFRFPTLFESICFPSSIGFNLSKFGSVLNVEYLFVPPVPELPPTLQTRGWGKWRGGEGGREWGREWGEWKREVCKISGCNALLRCWERWGWEGDGSHRLILISFCQWWPKLWIGSNDLILVFAQRREMVGQYFTPNVFIAPQGIHSLQQQLP